jgi:uncharacterized membrane protein
MEQFAREVVAVLIPIVDLVGAVVIGAGVLVAFVAYVLSELRLRPQPYEGVRLLLGRFLALGLEFQLASDILGTAVSPTYDQIGKLGAIAAIRTALNYFLSQELDRAREVVAEERAVSSDERGARPPVRADPPPPRADG